MLRFALPCALLLVVALLPALAADGEEQHDPVEEAVEQLVRGTDAASRERAREALRADPEAAVGALLRALEELAAAQRLATVAASSPAAAGDPAAAAEAGDGDGEHVVRVYDVRDLVERLGSADEIVERLRNVLQGSGTIDPRPHGMLIVRSSPPGLDAVESDLDALRRGSSEIVLVETRILVAPFGAPLGTVTGTARPGEVLLLEDPNATVAAWLAAGDAEVVNAPSLACYPGQEASIEIGSERSFVADFEVEVGQSSFLVDPVVDSIFEGLRLELRPTVPVAGRALVDLHAVATDVDLEPFRVDIVAPGGPVEIQIPSTFRTEVRRSLDLADGGTAVLRLGDDRDGMRFAAVTVKRLPMLDEE